ncbi:cyclin-D3-3-like [Abrus precatorius]|uniref:B-like cyclin n=1 Tax=Abrus precatorius TaxID=3816 RepID=A0A8B8MHV1_ABRPR|nr:cyclin-D3-3-like [Abrus precatorius]
MSGNWEAYDFTHSSLCPEYHLQLLPLNCMLFLKKTKMAHHHSKPLQDSLFCLEDHWEEEQVVEDDYYTTTTNSSPVVLLEHDLFWDHEELASLLSKEHHNKLCNCLQNNPSLALARKEAIEWILKVNAHYSFSALTTVLSVNYFDRFLFSFSFQNEKPWLTHLAAVACLSLAAKVEETHVPLCIDLQVEESRYLFEAKTVKRMEILVLSTLGWKMNPVTPLSFLDYITRRLGLKGYLCCEFLKRCEAVLLSVFSDSRFMSYLPSVLATATMMHVVNIVEPRLGVEYQNQLLGILGIHKDKVEECYKLVLEIVSGYDDKGKTFKFGKRKLGSVPWSPNGVMDGSFSCDSTNESWELGASVQSSPEPLSKKARTQDQLLLNHSNSDFLTIPR